MSSSRPVALVTGASSGIGIEFAKLLAQRDYDLILTARRGDRLQTIRDQLTNEFGIRVDIVIGDLGSVEGVEQVITDLKSLALKPTVLINNAGLGRHGALHEQTYAEYEPMIAVNVIALTRLAHAFAAELRAPGQRCYLLNVGSYSAFNPPSSYAVYAATKSYVLGLTQALVGPYRSLDIRVSVLCPGFFRSEFFGHAGHTPSPITNLLMSEPAFVARKGLSGLFRGKTLIVPGLIYRLALFGSRFVPRAWSTRLADWIMSH